MKKKLKEIFVLKESSCDYEDKKDLNEAGWAPIDLDMEEWGVVQMALTKFQPSDQVTKEIVDTIKNKLKVLGGSHDIGMGLDVKRKHDAIQGKKVSPFEPTQQMSTGITRKV